MFKHAFFLFAVVFALMALLLSCADLPTDPQQDPNNASVHLFLRDGGDPVVDMGTTRGVGLEIRLTNLLDSIYITSGCCTADTAFETDSTKLYDTVWIAPFFNEEGQCVLSARATMRNATLKDKTSSLSIRVLSEKPGISFITAPETFTTTAGVTDTLLFVTRTTGGAVVPPGYSIVTVPASTAALFTVEPTALGDTARVILTSQQPGTCVVSLIASTTYNGTSLADTASAAITIGNSMVPSTVDAPKQVIAGKADTLVFAVDNSTRPDPLTISLISKTPLDPAVFSIVPTGPDSILIAIASTATSAAADIGIVTGNGTVTDTAWYPVAVIGQADVVWSTTETALAAVEGTPLTVDLKTYLAAADVQDVSISADIGTVSSDNMWNFTPPWGCASIITAAITATRGNVSLALKVTLNVAAGDAEKPVLTLVDPSLDGKKVSASQIAIECEATDAGAGIESVTFTCGTQTVPAALQHGAVYSGVVTGLEHGVPAQITITATDASRAKNSASVTVTVTRDSTLLDAEAPAIVPLTGPKSGDRVTEPTGTLGFSVTDNSGVDSVWWTLNGAFMAAVPASGNTYTINYSLAAFNENVISLYAKDGSVAGNAGFSSVTLKYNTKPAAISLSKPLSNATGVSRSASFAWSGGSDADGDGVTCTVRYGTTQAILGSTATVNGMTATATLDYATTYYWQVTAKSTSTAYPDSVTSTVGIFTTEGSLPTVSVQPQSQSKEVGQSVTFSVTASANGFGALSYQWRENGSNVGTNSNSYTIPAVTSAMSGKEYDCVVTNTVGSTTSSKAALTVTAIPTFAVSFYVQYGSPTPTTQNVMRGEYATRPSDPVRTGYTFKDWYINGASQGFSFTTTPITADLQLVCDWTPIEYTITYNLNGGSTNGGNPEKYTAASANITLNNATRTGNYSFGGWYTDASFTSANVTSIPTGSTGNKVLYAKWQQLYSVTYSSNNATSGDAPTDGNTYTNGQTVTTKSNTGNLQKTGYTFNGWNTHADGSGTHYPAGGTFTMGSGNVDLYAEWDLKTVTVHFVCSYPIVNTSITVPYGTETLPVPWLSGVDVSGSRGEFTYTNGTTSCYFSAWYTDPECTNYYYDQPIESDLTVYSTEGWCQ